METDIARAKASLRSQMREAVGRVTPTVRMAASIQVGERLKAQMQSAANILFFAPMPDELDIWPVLEESLATRKVVALPFYDPAKKLYGARQIKDATRDVVPGRFGVREPGPTCPEVPLDKFHLVLVPGLAFDLHGNRLGRGLGFYDRLLAVTGGIKCGIAYDGQLLEKIPVEPHDARVNFILTPTRCVRQKT